MLTLALLRHAKSSWDQPGLDDFDRPLNARGTDAAPLMGAEIRRIGLQPDITLCSPALRTRQTLQLALPELVASGRGVRFDRDLYTASAEDLLAILRALPSEAKVALIVGHNPAMHNLALALVGSGAKEDLADLTDTYPTGALAVLTFEARHWREIDVRRGHLMHFTMPRRLSQT